MRAGSKLTVDGHDGTVWRKSGNRVLIDWKTGEPLRLPNGRTLGYAPSQCHTEWMPIDSPRIAGIGVSHNIGKDQT